MIRTSIKPLCVAACLLTATIGLRAQLPKLTPDITAKYKAPTTADDYVKRDVMIPMRDGVKLLHRHRRPQGREERADPADAHAVQRRRRAPSATESPHMLATLPQGDEVFVADGYIRVFQDVRGKYGSEGDYVDDAAAARAAQLDATSIIRPTPTTRSTGW